LQLPHVPGPVIRHEAVSTSARRSCRSTCPSSTRRSSRSGGSGERTSSRRSRSGDRDRKDVETVEEVRAEPSSSTRS
jgi:hypothetical protein